MKKVLAILAMTWSCLLSAQVISFTDAEFKDRLINYPCVDIDSDNIADIDADSNNDGEIDANEALVVTTLIMNNGYISDLGEIEYFTNLKHLEVSSNLITSLDLHSLIHLEELNCSFNHLSALNLQGLSALRRLSLGYNLMTSIDLQSQHSLQYVMLTYNQISSLDLSNQLDLEYLICDHNTLSSLDVQGSINLRELNCDYNALTGLNLQGFSSLIHLTCQENQLSYLNLQGANSLEYLDCSVNLISSLDVHNFNNLTYLMCNANQIATLNTQNANNLITLGCTSNQLTSLDVQSMSNLTSLYCSFNPLGTLDVHGLSHLVYLYCVVNQLDSLNLDGLNSLYTLCCSNNNIKTLHAEDLSHLRNLTCNSNQLQSLYIRNNNREANIELYHNPNLNYICCDDDQVLSVQTTLAENGIYNCTVSTYCGSTFSSPLYTIKGTQYFDADLNGCNPNDSSFTNIVYNIDNNVLPGYCVSSNSRYTINVPVGNYTIKPILPNTNNYFTITPDSFIVSFPATSDTVNQDFCISPNGTHHDVEIAIIPIIPPTTSRASVYSIVYKNKGNQIEDGYLHFMFDESVFNVVSVNSPVYAQTSNTLTWHYDDLMPFESREIQVTLDCSASTIPIHLLLGDTLLFLADIQHSHIDETSLDNNFTLVQNMLNTISNGNNKVCLEGDAITPDRIGDYIYYSINFENDGFYQAQNVTLTDVIDTTRLDISSVQVVSSSHPEYTSIINGNTLVFKYIDINLPFSAPDNKGYVAFKIKTKSDLSLGNTIYNYARIDFSPDTILITNQTQTTIRTNAPSHINNINNASSIVIYPNPVMDILYLQTQANLEQASIYDLNGKLVLQTSLSQAQLSTKSLSSGTYIIKIYTSTGVAVEKFVKL